MFGFVASGENHAAMMEEQLQALQSCLCAVEHGNAWPAADALETAFETSKAALKNDLKTLGRENSFIFATDIGVQDLTEQTAARIREWQILGNAPSLPALAAFALNWLTKNPTPDMQMLVLTAAILGEVENDIPYHDAMHYKKVTLQTIRMIAVHNDIYAGTARMLDDSQITTLLAAACIHDIGHDGQGNVVKGVHIEGRAEKLSFSYALPYFEAANCADENTLQQIYTMLLTTDVSPLDDPGNPMHQMKAAYRFHFRGEQSRTHSLNLSKDLAVLEKDSALATLCLILHEADIATSAGLNYAVTQYETALLRVEFCEDEGRPSHVLDFLKQICGRRILSDAGQKLYAANLARIYARAEEDLKNGNHPYPKPQHTDFILGLKNTRGQSRKTVN